MSNKGSDKNVGSIEDVKEHKINLSQKQSIELLKDTLNKFEIRGEQLYLLKLAIKNLLAEREQDKKRIQELEEESEILEFQNKQVENYAEELKKYNKTVSDRMVEYKKNSIPKQAVIDKIEELNKEIKSCDEIDAIFKIKQQQILQELLEGERK